MATKASIEPFVCDLIQWRCKPGILLCDPERVDQFFKGEARQRDLNNDFFSGDEKDVFSEGIAVALFEIQHQQSKVAVRSEHAKSHLPGKSPKSSRGWILGTKSGQLVLCSTDALLFWDPYEDDEDPRRYVKFSIPAGWYDVTINFESPSDTDDRWEDDVEFVLTRKRVRPKFTAAPCAADSSRSAEIVEAPQKEPASQKANEPLPSVDRGLAKAVLSQLTPMAFETFVTKLFNRDKEYYECLTKAEGLGDGIFYQPLSSSYGGSLHSVFLLQYLPLTLFNQPQIDRLADDPTLAARLVSLRKEYNGAAGYIGMVSPELVKATQLRSLGFLVNLSGLLRQDYNEKIFPQYGELVRKIGLHAPVTLVGSYDSFLDFSALAVQELFKDFLTNRNEGFAIQIGPSGPRVLNFATESSFESGVLRSNSCPYEPIIAAASRQNAALIAEFESLLLKDSSEKELEDFLVAHAKDVFGEKYDRIEPQIWLRFPHLDIAGKERRMDIFMRNSVSRDWDLFEIKKPIPLIRTHRDGPAMVAEIAHSITQLKRYAHLLSQRTVKETLKQSGIEYCEPSLNLVVGRRPSIPLEQWRWLLSCHNNDVKLLTFDDLADEMKIRLADRLRFVQELKAEPQR